MAPVLAEMTIDQLHQELMHLSARIDELQTTMHHLLHALITLRATPPYNRDHARNLHREFMVLHEQRMTLHTALMQVHAALQGRRRSSS